MAVRSASKGKTVRQRVRREEWERRVDLAATYRLMDVYGMTELSANHISTLPQTRRPFGVLEWPALLRKLDKIDPWFRD